MKQKVRADYEYSINRVKKRLAIVDLNLGRMSVTNCIEDVVDEIAQNENINHYFKNKNNGNQRNKR
jgi:hypothetical protein